MEDSEHSIPPAFTDPNLKAHPGQLKGADDDGALSSECTSTTESGLGDGDGDRAEVLDYLKTLIQARLKGSWTSQSTANPEASAKLSDLKDKGGSSPTSKGSRETEDVSYKCALCHREFMSLSMLDIHQRVYHTRKASTEAEDARELGIKVCCMRCRKGFAEASDVNEHVCFNLVSSAAAGEDRESPKSDVDVASDVEHSSGDGGGCSPVPGKERQHHHCAMTDDCTSNTKQAACDELLHAVEETAHLCTDCGGHFQSSAERAAHECVGRESKLAVYLNEASTDVEMAAPQPDQNSRPTFQGGGSYQPDAAGDAPGNKAAGDPGGKDTSLICGPCGQLFPSAEDMQQHKCSRRCETEFPCSVCELKFKLFRSYRLHMKSVHQLESFQCSRCSQVFHGEDDLKAHPCQQNNRRPHLCDICGKSYKTAAYLSTHKLSHLGIRPHKCVVCGKGFTQPSNLQTHMRIHRGERPFACKVCGKSFRQLDHLMKHSGVHTKDAPYACETCGKRFRDEDYVKKHMRIHTGDMPFKCKDCGMKFRWANRFAAHKCTQDSDPDALGGAKEDFSSNEKTSLPTRGNSLSSSGGGQSVNGGCFEQPADSSSVKQASKHGSEEPANVKPGHYNMNKPSNLTKEHPLVPSPSTKMPAETDCNSEPVCKAKWMGLLQGSSDFLEHKKLSEDVGPDPTVALKVPDSNGTVAGLGVNNEQCDSDSDDDQGRLQIVEDEEKDENCSSKISESDVSPELNVADTCLNKNEAVAVVSSASSNGKQSRLLAQMLMGQTSSSEAVCAPARTEVASSTSDAGVRDSVACDRSGIAGTTPVSMHEVGLPRAEGVGVSKQPEVSTSAREQSVIHASVPPGHSGLSPSSTSRVVSELSLREGTHQGSSRVVDDAVVSCDRGLALPLHFSDMCSIHGDQSIIDSLTSNLVKKYINLPPSPPRGSVRGVESALPQVDLALPEGSAVEESFPPMLSSSVPARDFPAPLDWPLAASPAAVNPMSSGPEDSEGAQLSLTVANVTSLSQSEFERLPLCAPSPSPLQSEHQSTVIQKGPSFEGPIPFAAQKSDVYTIMNEGPFRLRHVVKNVRPPVDHPAVPRASHALPLSDGRIPARPTVLANSSAPGNTQSTRPEVAAAHTAAAHSQSMRRPPLTEAAVIHGSGEGLAAAMPRSRPAHVSDPEMRRRLQQRPAAPTHASLAPRHVLPAPTHAPRAPAHTSPLVSYRPPIPTPSPGSPRHILSRKAPLTSPYPREGSISASAVAAPPAPPRAHAAAPRTSIGLKPPSLREGRRGSSQAHSAGVPVAHRAAPARAVGLEGPAPRVQMVSLPSDEPMDLSVPRNRPMEDRAAPETRAVGSPLVSRRNSKEMADNRVRVEVPPAESSVVNLEAPVAPVVSVAASSALSSTVLEPSALVNLGKESSPALGVAPGQPDASLVPANNGSLPVGAPASMHAPPSGLSTINTSAMPEADLAPASSAVSGSGGRPEGVAASVDAAAHQSKRPGLPIVKKCILCGAEFRWRPFKPSQKCLQCCKKTGTSTGKSHVCDICGKEFTQSGNLRTHLRLHAGDKPYQCHVCHKRFALMKYLNSHVRMHSAEKQFECKVCGKKLRDATYIKHHMRVHTGAKPFQCKACLKEFRWRSEFRSHKCTSSRPQLEKRSLRIRVADSNLTESERMFRRIALQNGIPQSVAVLLPAGVGSSPADGMPEALLESGAPGKDIMFSKFRWRKEAAVRKRSKRDIQSTTGLSEEGMTDTPEVVGSQNEVASGGAADRVLSPGEGQEMPTTLSERPELPKTGAPTFEAPVVGSAGHMEFGLVRIVDEQKGLAEVVWTSSNGQSFTHGPAGSAAGAAPAAAGQGSGGNHLPQAPQLVSPPKSRCLPTDVLLLQNDYIHGDRSEESEGEVKTEPQDEAACRSETSDARLPEERSEVEASSTKDGYTGGGDSAQRERSDDGYDTFDERRQSDSDDRANAAALPGSSEEVFTEAERRTAALGSTESPAAAPPASGLELLSQVCATSRKPSGPAAKARACPPAREKPAALSSADASGCDLAPLNVMVSNILALRPDMPNSRTSKPSACAARPSGKIFPRSPVSPSKPGQPAPLGPSDGGVVWVPMSSLQFPAGTIFVDQSKAFPAAASSQGQLPQTTSAPSNQPVSQVQSPSEQASIAGAKAQEVVPGEGHAARDSNRRLCLTLKRKSSECDRFDKWEVEEKKPNKANEGLSVPDESSGLRAGEQGLAVGEKSSGDASRSVAREPESVIPHSSPAPGEQSRSQEGNTHEQSQVVTADGAVAPDASSATSSNRDKVRSNSRQISKKRKKRHRRRKARRKRENDDPLSNEAAGGSRVRVKKRRRAEGELLVADTTKLLSDKRTNARASKNEIASRFTRRGRGSLVCPVCDARFMQASRLEAHMLQHTVDSTRQCPVCHKVFSKPGNLAQHMLIHTDSRPFACTVCGLRFRQRHHMITHLRVHSDLKNHECQFCHKKLRDRWYLKQHLRIHTGERPFKCFDCGQTFRWKAPLKTHKCSKASDDVDDEVTEAESPGSPSPRDNSSPVSKKTDAEKRRRASLTEDVPLSQGEESTVNETESGTEEVKLTPVTTVPENCNLAENRDSAGNPRMDQPMGSVDGSCTAIENAAIAQKSANLSKSAVNSFQSSVIANTLSVTQNSVNSHMDSPVIQHPAEPKAHSANSLSESNNTTTTKARGPLLDGGPLHPTSVNTVIPDRPALDNTNTQPRYVISSAASEPQPSSGGCTSSQNLKGRAPPGKRPTPSQRSQVRKSPAADCLQLPLSGPPPLIEAQALYQAQALPRMNLPMDLSVGPQRAAHEVSVRELKDVARGDPSQTNDVLAAAARPREHFTAAATGRLAPVEGNGSGVQMVNLADLPRPYVRREGATLGPRGADGMQRMESFSSAATTVPALPHPRGPPISPSGVTFARNFPLYAPPGSGLSTESVHLGMPLVSSVQASQAGERPVHSGAPSKENVFLSPYVAQTRPPVPAAAGVERQVEVTEVSRGDPAALVASSAAPDSYSAAPSSVPLVPSPHSQVRSSHTSAVSLPPAEAVSRNLAPQSAVLSERVTACQPQPAHSAVMRAPVEVIAGAPAPRTDLPVRHESMGPQPVVFVAGAGTFPVSINVGGASDAQFSAPNSRLGSLPGVVQGNLIPAPRLPPPSSAVTSSALGAEPRYVLLEGYHPPHPMSSLASSRGVSGDATRPAVQDLGASAPSGSQGGASSPVSPDGDVTNSSTPSTVSSPTQDVRDPLPGEGQSSFLCGTCGRTFPSKLTLRRHMRAHNKPAPYRCPDCDKGFHQPELLEAHKPDCSGYNPRKCPTCGKVFSQTGNCKKHMLIHQDARPYACDLCHKRFRALYHLQCHMTTHNDARPYSCELCGKTFRDGSYIKKHMRLHTGELPYKCEYCSESFRWSSVYAKHLNRVHGQAAVKSSDEQASPLTQPQLQPS